MIGGRVIQIEGGDVRKIWVCSPGEGELCVHAKIGDAARWPVLGEEVWWQAGEIMFGGHDRTSGEMRLQKIGYSHNPGACRGEHD